jgi:hypothetical protein
VVLLTTSGAEEVRVRRGTAVPCVATTQERDFFGKAAPTEPGSEGRHEEKITGYLEAPDRDRMKTWRPPHAEGL